MKMDFEGIRIRCFINDQLIFNVLDLAYTNGGMGLYNAGGHTHFDDVLVTGEEEDDEDDDEDDDKPGR